MRSTMWGHLVQMPNLKLLRSKMPNLEFIEMSAENLKLCSRATQKYDFTFKPTPPDSKMAKNRQNRTDIFTILQF